MTRTTKFFAIFILLLMTISSVIVAYNFYHWRIVVKTYSQFNEQFKPGDIVGAPDAALQNVVAACDKTTNMLPSLIAEGFTVFAAGRALDVHDKLFAIAYWKKSTESDLQFIVTTTNQSGITCIVTISSGITIVTPESEDITPGREYPQNKENIDYNLVT